MLQDYSVPMELTKNYKMMSTLVTDLKYTTHVEEKTKLNG